jgi:hypothetical protein
LGIFVGRGGGGEKGNLNLFLTLKKAIMSSSIATREFGYFLVKFEVDDRYYVCTRIKILTEGRATKINNQLIYCNENK